MTRTHGRIETEGEWALREVPVVSNEWSALLAQRAHLVFHTPIWANVLETGFNGACHALVLERNGEIVGGMLGVVFQVLWARLFHVSYPYGGIFGECPGGPVLKALLHAFAAEHRIARVRLTQGPDMPSLPAEGFTVEDLQTHVLRINGRPYNEIWESYRRTIRRDVRKSGKSRVTVVEADSVQAVESLYTLYLESMKRNKAVPKYRKELIVSIFEHLIARNRGALLLAKREGETLAGLVVVDSDLASHYLFGGSRSAELKYCPNDLLIHVAIKRAAQLGLSYFDFLPSGPSNPDLVRFKTKWGSEACSAKVHTLVTRPLVLGLWNAAYSLAATTPARAILTRYRESS